MENVHGKEISLQYVTVKVPGQKPRGSRTAPATANSTAAAPNNQNNDVLGSNNFKSERKGEKVLLTGYEIIREPSGGEENGEQFGSNGPLAFETPSSTNNKKRHRRIKTNGTKSNDLDGGKKPFL